MARYTHKNSVENSQDCCYIISWTVFWNGHKKWFSTAISNNKYYLENFDPQPSYWVEWWTSFFNWYNNSLSIIRRKPRRPLSNQTELYGNETKNVYKTDGNEW